MNYHHKTNILHYRCLYTLQKTQKRKRWTDGKLTLNLNSQQALLYPIPPINAAPLDTLEISTWQMNAVRSKQVEELVFEKFLVQIDGVWDENCGGFMNNCHQVSSSSSSSSSSLSMHKLLSKKFVRPAPFVPRLTNSSVNSNDDNYGDGDGNKKRCRPLQPGELMRQHYGEDVVAKQQQTVPHFLEDSNVFVPNANRDKMTINQGRHHSQHSRENIDPVVCDTGGRGRDNYDHNSVVAHGLHLQQYDEQKYYRTKSQAVHPDSIEQQNHVRCNPRDQFRSGNSRKIYNDDLVDACDYNASEFYGEQKFSYHDDEDDFKVANISQSYQGTEIRRIKKMTEGKDVISTSATSYRVSQAKNSLDQFRASSSHEILKSFSRPDDLKKKATNKSNERVSKSDLLQLFGADSFHESESEGPSAKAVKNESDIPPLASMTTKLLDSPEKRITKSIHDGEAYQPGNPVKAATTNFWSGLFDEDDDNAFDSNTNGNAMTQELNKELPFRGINPEARQFGLTLPSPCSSSSDDFDDDS